MEDDFEKIWEDYNQNIPEISPKKEELSPFLNLKTSSQRAASWERWTWWILPAISALIWWILGYYGLENGYRINAVSLLIISVLELIMQGWKLKMYRELNSYQNTLSQTLQKLDKLQKWLVWERVLAVFLAPLVVVLLLPFARFVLYGENLFENTDFYLLLAGLALLLGGGLSWFLYQKWLITPLQKLRAELEALRD